MVAADAYMMFGEARDITTLAASNLVGEALAPFDRLGVTPKEVSALREFFARHGKILDTAQVSFAAQPSRPGLPQVIVAVRCADASAARELEAPLGSLLRTLFGGEAAPKSAPKTLQAAPARPTLRTGPAAPRAAAAATPYKLKRLDRFLFISDADFKLTDIKPPRTASLAESNRFRQAQARLASESVFVYYDFELVEQEFQRLARERKRVEEEMIRNEREAAKQGIGEIEQGEGMTAGGLPATVSEDKVNHDANAAEAADRVEPIVGEGEGTSASLSGDTGSTIGIPSLGLLLPSFFGGSFKQMIGGADSLGVGASLSADGIALRVLLATPDKDHVSPIPFMPQLVSGAPQGSRAASLLPAETDLFVSLSLDLTKSYDEFIDAAGKSARNTQTSVVTTAAPPTSQANDATHTPGNEANAINPMQAYVALMEARFGFKIKDELLPTLGSEVALGVLPEKEKEEDKNAKAKTSVDGATTVGDKESETDPAAVSSKGGYVALVSVRDKPRLMELLPKALGAFGLKLPNSALIERRGDIEYIRFSGAAAAFVGDFLVVSTDDDTLSRVVETAQGGRTLASDERFTAARAWQPRDRLGELFVRGETIAKLFGDERRWITSVVSDLEPFFAEYGLDQSPVSLVLTGDATGSQHELHIPRSLIVSTMAQTAADAKHGDKVRNERYATYRLQGIHYAQQAYREKNKRYGSIEDLKRAELLYEPDTDTNGYKISLSFDDDHFSATATPVTYGVTGRRSFFIDHTGTLRAGDHGGKAASATDPAVR